jgi:hypothetical protein
MQSGPYRREEGGCLPIAVHTVHRIREGIRLHSRQADRAHAPDGRVEPRTAAEAGRSVGVGRFPRRAVEAGRAVFAVGAQAVLGAVLADRLRPGMLAVCTIATVSTRPSYLQVAVSCVALLRLVPDRHTGRKLTHRPNKTAPP